MKTLFGFLTCLFLPMSIAAQEYKVITSVESIGFGPSYIVDHADSAAYEEFTRQFGGGAPKSKGRSSRPKSSNFEETQLLQVRSGYSFDSQSLATNDAVISSKLTAMAKDGWKLVFVNTAVESDAGDNDDFGVLITRYIFQKD